MAEDEVNGKTTAPTNSTTLESFSKGNAQFTELELDFVTLVRMHFARTGDVMNLKVAEEQYFIDEPEYRKCMQNNLVLDALEKNGISFKRVVALSGKEVDNSNPDWRMVGITPKQLHVANQMLDFRDTRSDKKKLQDNDVDTKVYAAWLQDPIFSGYLADTAERMMGANQHEASLALIDKVRMGDIKAIALYMEVTGRYVKQTTVNPGTSNSNFDAVQLINDLVEIIIEEVDDQETAHRIAERLKNLMTKRAIVNSLITEPEVIHIPESVANRELTPELMAAMKRGVGIDT